MPTAYLDKYHIIVGSYYMQRKTYIASALGHHTENSLFRALESAHEEHKW